MAFAKDGDPPFQPTKFDELLSKFSLSATEKKEINLGNQLVGFLTENSEQLNKYQYLIKFVEGLGSDWVDQPDLEICRYGLEALTIIAEKLQRQFGDYIGLVYYRVIKFIGYEDETVRAAVRQFIFKCVEVKALSPYQILYKMMSLLDEKKPIITAEAEIINYGIISQSNFLRRSIIVELIFAHAPFLGPTRTGHPYEIIRNLRQKLGSNKFIEVYGAVMIKHPSNEYVRAHCKRSFDNVPIQELNEDDYDEDFCGDDYPLIGLHEAVSKGFTFMIDSYLVQGADINDRNHLGQTALHIAFTKNYQTLAEYLISKGADTSVRDESGHTPLDLVPNKGNHNIYELVTILKSKNQTGLEVAIEKDDDYFFSELLENELIEKSNLSNIFHTAVTKGATRIVKILLTKVDINEKNVEGQTALIVAVDKNLISLVDLLLNNGACTNIYDKNGFTPLHVTAKNDCTTLVNKLVRFGGNLNSQSISGHTPLHVCVLHRSKFVLHLLLQNGANPNIKDENGQTALHLLAPLNESLFVVDELFRTKIDINIRNNNFKTPLMYAITQKNTGLALTLIEKGADLELKDIDDNSVLHLAVRKADIVVSHKLLKLKIDLKSRNKFGFTPFHQAVHSYLLTCLDSEKEHNWNIVQEFLKYVDVNIVDGKGESVLHYAAQHGSLQLTELLCGNNINPDIKNNHGETALHKAAICSWPIFNYLLGKTNYTIQNNKGMTAVQLLFYKHLDGSIKDISNIDELFETVNKLGDALIHSVTELRLNNIINFLVEMGCNVDCRNIKGETPLHRSVDVSDINSVQYFLKKGADIQAIDLFGNGPLHKAVKCDDGEMIKLLSAKGGDVNLRNSKKQTPLHLAVVNVETHHSILWSLLDEGAELTITDEENLTPVDIAVRYPIQSKIRNVLMRHIVVMESLKVNLNLNVDLYDLEDFIDFKNACLEEQGNLKKFPINDSISLYDIVFNKLLDPFFVKNCDLKEYINSPLAKMFPIYAVHIKRAFKMAEKRHNLMLIALTSFNNKISKSLRIILPEELILKICCFLTSEELEGMIKGFPEEEEEYI